MDLIDSAAPTPVTGHIDVSSADDDSISSAIAALTRDASVAFHSGKFEECVDLLNQLLQKKDDDPKVLHNIAIARYFQDRSSDPKKLLEVLLSVKKQSDELAQATGEQSENDSGMNKAASGSKGTNSLAHQLSGGIPPHMVFSDEFDTSVIMLNTAVVWFHLHEYFKAYSVLDSLYQKIEPIDEATVLRICLLFLDVSLACHDPWKFVDMIDYVEKGYCASNLIRQSDNMSSQQQSLTAVAKSSSLPSNPDASGSDSVASAVPEDPLSRTLSEENLETLISTIDMSGQTLARPSSLQSSSDLPRTLTDHYITTSDLRLKLQLYKVRFLLFTKNLKTAKREVKIAMAMNVASGKDSSVALLLKSQFEYARGNYQKAIKLLMASANRAESGFSSIFNNNLGCIYYRLGKYHTSAVFFSKALRSSSSLRKQRPLKLSTFSQDKSVEIVYNCGLQYLACGKPILAARCFHKASLVFYKQPLLWFRIAECCIMAQEKGLLRSNTSESVSSEVKVHVIGKGLWRQLATEDGFSHSAKSELVKREDLFPDDDKSLKLSMSLARQCLFNGLYLLNCPESKHSNSAFPNSSFMDESESREAKTTNHKTVPGGESKASNAGQNNPNGDVKEQKSGGVSTSTLQSSISDYVDLREKENQKMKQAFLASLAYVELELGNPLKALSTARSLLALPECSRVYIFLANVYAAESLCLLNRPKEAAEHLLIYLSGENTLQQPYNDEDCEQWRGEKNTDSEDSLNNTKNPWLDETQDSSLVKPEEARGTLYANLAVTCALQGDLEQADRFATQSVSEIPRSAEAFLTAVYVDLMIGRTQEALAKLKQSSHVRFLSGSSAVESQC